MNQYFSLGTFEELKALAGGYLPLVRVVLGSFGIDTEKEKLVGDHFGVIVTTPEDFDACDKSILGYSELIHSGLVKERRNNIYKFKEPISAGGIVIPKIEIFEYTPKENDRFLKYGLDHVCFKVEDFDIFLAREQEKGIPIERIILGDYGHGGKFFKTKTISNVMIEFRNDALGEWKDSQ